MVDGSLVVFFNLGQILFPTHHIEDATIGDDLGRKGVRSRLRLQTSALSVWLAALISDSAVDAKMLPWSVEHQHMKLPARYPR